MFDDFFDDSIFGKIVVFTLSAFLIYVYFENGPVKKPDEIAVFINNQQEELKDCIKENIFQYINNENKIYQKNLNKSVKVCEKENNIKNKIKEIDLILKTVD